MSGITYGAAIGAVIVLISAFQLGWWLRLLSLLILFLGYVVSDYFLRYADGIPDMFSLSSPASSANPCRQRRKRRQISASSSSASVSAACGVCGSENCNRGHDSSSSGSVYAFGNGAVGPKIPKIIDDALQDFFDMTLKKYVEKWYETLISREDKTFVKQLRIHIRYALCQCWCRLQHVDLPHVILDEVVPVAINHAAVYADVRRQNSGSLENLEDRVLERMSSTKLLHPAMRSRSCELAYLKRLVDYGISRCADKSLSPTTLAFLRELLTFEVCLPAVDAVADPDVVNRLLELFFDPLPMRTFEGDLSEKVVLLNRFVDEKNPHALSDTVVFQTKLSEIIRDPPLLYMFMTYLKSVNAPMNWLQFILLAHDIQEQLHSGRTLTREDISHLHWQSWELYRNYLHEGAPDKLGDDLIPPSLANELKLGVEAEPEKAMGIIGQILEQAYQIVYQHLQWRYVTPFCQSAKFMELICAARNRDEDDKEETAATANSSLGVSLGIGDQQLLIKEDIDDAFGSYVANSGSASGSGSASDDEEAELVQQPTPTADEGLAAMGPRDLSLWKASLPRIEPRRDPQTGRTMYVYVIEVEATDMGSRRWCTDRRYREFYVLESKLVEFHGEQVRGGFPLPPKKTFNNKSRAFVESQRAIFDQFLKRLLHNPALKGSELLHAFLTSPNELTASFLPDPFKVMRKMPGKLARERGQNLAPFLHSLISSITKTSSNELKPPENSGRVSPYMAGRTSPFPGASGGTSAAKVLQDKLYGTQYKNNFDLMTRSSSVPLGKLDDMLVHGGLAATEPCVLTGVYDALIFLAQKVFQIPYFSWALFVSARSVIRRTFDSYVRRYLGRQLETAMHEQRLVLVINALRELVFEDDEDGLRGEEERRKRKENAFALAKLYFESELGLVKHIVGEESFNGGLALIFDCLQCPRLNKQLFYVLLDSAAREVFPELL